MSKRKNKDPGRAPQVHPQRSFDQMVADATLARLGGYIDSEIQEAAQGILARQQQAMANLLTRLVATEEVLIEKLGLTKEDLANRVANIQDRSEGFVAAETVEVGDRVRLEIQTRTADQAEFQGSSRLLVDNAGTGSQLGKELEGALVGMKAGESKEIKFGKDESLVARLSVNKVSRQPKAEPTETKEESEASEAAIGDGAEGRAPQEAPNASADAG